MLFLPVGPNLCFLATGVAGMDTGALVQVAGVAGMDTGAPVQVTGVAGMDTPQTGEVCLPSTATITLSSS